MSARAHRGRRSREGWCRSTLQVLALCFAVAGAQFLFLPDETVATINAVGVWLGNFPPAPPSVLRFWLSLATGHMALIAATLAGGLAEHPALEKPDVLPAGSPPSAPRPTPTSILTRMKEFWE